MKLNKRRYWDKVVAHFYDNIWDGKANNLYSWARREYNMRVTPSSPELHFDNPRDATLFMIRWA